MKYNKNRTQSIVESIQNDIIMGVLIPGDKLLSLRALCSKYGVSRSVINNAIISLETKGYVKIVPRHYVVVSDFLRTGSIEVFSNIFHGKNESLKKQMISSALDARMLVECEATRIIVSLRNDFTDLVKIVEQENIWRLSKDKNILIQCQLDYDFHQCLVKLSDNMVYGIIYHSFDYLINAMIALFYQEDKIYEKVIDQHIELIQAFERHDSLSAVEVCKKMLDYGAKKVALKL